MELIDCQLNLGQRRPQRTQVVLLGEDSHRPVVLLSELLDGHVRHTALGQARGVEDLFHRACALGVGTAGVPLFQLCEYPANLLEVELHMLGSYAGLGDHPEAGLVARADTLERAFREEGSHDGSLTQVVCVGRLPHPRYELHRDDPDEQQQVEGDDAHRDHSTLVTKELAERR